MVDVSKGVAPKPFIHTTKMPRYRAIAVTVAVFVIVAAAIATYVKVVNLSQGSVASDPHAQSAAQLAEWASTAVSPSAQFVVRDADIADQLAEDGLTGLRRSLASSGSLTTTFLVSATSSAMPSEVVGRSVAPIARFGSGTHSLTVAIFSSMTVGEIRRLLSAARQDRMSAARELLTNTAVRTTPKQAQLLRAGRVDLRAVAFLAQLATQQHVQLSAIRIDPHESAVGTPARQITVLVPSAQLVADLVSATTGAYHPNITRVSTTAKGASVVLVWSLAPLTNLVLR